MPSLKSTKSNIIFQYNKVKKSAKSEEQEARNSETCLGSASLNLPAPIARSISITEGRRGFGSRRDSRGLLIGRESGFVPLVLRGGEWESPVGLSEARATFMVTEMQQKEAIVCCVQSFFFVSISRTFKPNYQNIFLSILGLMRKLSWLLKEIR